VCSNKPVAFTRELLAAMGLAERFDVVLGPEDVPRPKPAPDMLRVALERLGEQRYRDQRHRPHQRTDRLAPHDLGRQERDGR